ncbi:Putative uncharacterized protein FLJ37770 [Eumeta japonica]|uniref:Histone-lysine N-methyltransferase SETMAR n=1 Tax=Eumeta variegata TaxID=151549 RepID=A0A4C1Y9L8_EUMVA|nr:Putative uncharacterized protein FLJ37770 [Eumeta japonica]
MARLFQQGRENCEDDPRPGRPVTVVTEENVRKIEKLVLADRRIKLWQIAEELQISKERVGEIIHVHINMRKISARWVPKMLTPFDKQRRLQTSTRGSRTEATWEVIARSAVFTRHASVHTARVSRQALKDTGFSEIDHPPYSTDLALGDYFLFSNLKKKLRGRRFVDDNQMKMAIEIHFDCKEKEYFLGGLKALYTRSESILLPEWEAASKFETGIEIEDEIRTKIVRGTKIRIKSAYRGNHVKKRRANSGGARRRRRPTASRLKGPRKKFCLQVIKKRPRKPDVADVHEWCSAATAR